MAALNFKQLQQAVREARSASQRAARQCGRPTPYVTHSGRSARTPLYGFVRSRGVVLATSDAGGQCQPAAEAECPEWHGTKREIEQLVAEVLASYPAVTEVYIAGGHDISQAIDFDDYEPRVSEWCVVVWTRDGGYAAVPVAEVN